LIVGITQSARQRTLQGEIESLIRQNRERSQLAPIGATRPSLGGNPVARSPNSQALPAEPPLDTSAAEPLSTELDQQPVPLDQTEPVYPSDLRSSGLHPTITVEFLVGPDGTATQGAVLRMAEAGRSSVKMAAFNPDGSALDAGEEMPPAARAEFEAAAVQAVDQWVFQPGRRHGKTITTRMQVPVVFLRP
jgi:outer membrane biosynthesis protein TonB